MSRFQAVQSSGPPEPGRETEAQRTPYLTSELNRGEAGSVEKKIPQSPAPAKQARRPTPQDTKGPTARGEPLNGSSESAHEVTEDKRQANTENATTKSQGSPFLSVYHVSS